MRKRKRKLRTRLTSLLPKFSNEVFDSRPDEIFALRKCIGWSRLEMGLCVGLSVNQTAGDCHGIYRWERGISRPHTIYRVKLLQLVELFRDQYLEKLNAIRSGAIRYQVDKSIRSEDRKSSEATNPFSLSS